MPVIEKFKSQFMQLNISSHDISFTETNFTATIETN